MEYQGKLYGKVGKHYFPMMQTTEDFDKLEKQRDELIECLQVLCDLKHIKDLDGKTPYYLEKQPLAWQKANELLTKTQHNE